MDEVGQIVIFDIDIFHKKYIVLPFKSYILTHNKEYTIKGIMAKSDYYSKDRYIITNDYGVDYYYDKEYFTKLSERRNEIINNIL